MSFGEQKGSLGVARFFGYNFMCHHNVMAGDLPNTRSGHLMVNGSGSLTEGHYEWCGQAEGDDHGEDDKIPSILNTISKLVISSLWKGTDTHDMKMSEGHAQEQ